MRVKVIHEFSTARGIVPVGSILEISETLLTKLNGKVTPVKIPAAPSTCQARKINPARICGAPLKEGINGHLSCSDMFCQVPYKRGQK